MSLLHPGFNKTDMTKKYEHIWEVTGGITTLVVVVVVVGGLVVVILVVVAVVLFKTIGNMFVFDYSFGSGQYR